VSGVNLAIIIVCLKQSCSMGHLRCRHQCNFNKMPVTPVLHKRWRTIERSCIDWPRRINYNYQKAGNTSSTTELCNVFCLVFAGPDGEKSMGLNYLFTSFDHDYQVIIDVINFSTLERWNTTLWIWNSCKFFAVFVVYLWKSGRKIRHTPLS
jgi:hypothetical protein